MSTSSGSGVGGSVGGPQQPTIFELEQRGIQDAIKQRLAIAPELDTIHYTPLLDDNVRKYRASPERPVLAPIDQMRIKASLDPAHDENIQVVYQELMKQLPPELQTALRKDQERPFEQRNQDFVILNNLLQALAHTLIGIDNAAQPKPAESLENARTTLAQHLPFLGFKSALGFSGELANYMSGILDQIGPNDPIFDTARSALSDAKEITNQLTNFYKKYIDGNLQGFPTADLSEAAAKIETANQIFQRDSNGENYQILRHTMAGTALFAAALSLHNLAPLAVISLYLSNIGNADPEQGGTYSAELDNLIHQTSTGLKTLLGWNGPADTAKVKSLDTILHTLALLAASGGAYLGQEGIGPFPNQGDIVGAKRFSADLGLTMLTHSGILDSVSTDLASALEVKDKEVAPIASALSLWTLIWGIQGAETSGVSRADQLFESAQPYLLNHLQTLEQYVTQKQQEGQTDPLTQGVGVFLNQALIALQEHDYNGLADSLKSLSGLTGYPEEKTITDLKSTASFGTIAHDAFTTQTKDASTITGISQA